MKKTLLYILLFFSSSALFSQSFGLRAGANVATLSGDIEDASSILAYQFGAFAEFSLTTSSDINLAVLYNKKGAKDNTSEEDVSIQYLEIPLLFRYNIAIAFFEIGPYASYLLSADVAGIDIKDLLKNSEFGLIFGAGVKFGNIGFDARYGLGISDINEFDNETIKNSVITLGAEFKF